MAPTSIPLARGPEAAMKLTRACVYALHALAYLAARGRSGPVGSHQIAEARGIPERFLLKVLKPLVSAGVLQSLKGPNGGYRLARPAAEVSLLEVIEAVEGPIRGQALLIDSPAARALDRRLEAVCDEAADAAREGLGRVRLSDLAVGEGGKGKGRR